MSIDFGKIKDILSLTVKQVLIVLVASWSLLLLPDGLLARMGLVDLRNDFRAWVGLVALVSLAWLVALPIYNLGVWVEKEVVYWRIRRNGLAILRNLSSVEKEYLRQYIDQNTTTLTFELSDGVVQGLQQKGLIVRVSSVGRPSPRPEFDYNIQPWADRVLRENPNLLQGSASRPQGGRRGY